MFEQFFFNYFDPICQNLSKDFVLQGIKQIEKILFSKKSSKKGENNLPKL